MRLIWLLAVAPLIASCSPGLNDRQSDEVGDIAGDVASDVIADDDKIRDLEARIEALESKVGQ